MAESRSGGQRTRRPSPGARMVVDETVGSEVQITLGTGSAQVVQVPNRLGTTLLPTRSAAGASAPSPAVTIKARATDSNICAPRARPERPVST